MLKLPNPTKFSATVVDINKVREPACRLVRPSNLANHDMPNFRYQENCTFAGAIERNIQSNLWTQTTLEALNFVAAADRLLLFSGTCML